MKLTGEYQLTDHGVVIEGRIHNTHIAELREKFLAAPEARSFVGEVYPGDPELIRMAGLEPSSVVRKTLTSRWFYRVGSFSKDKLVKDLGFKPSSLDWSNEFLRMGLQIDNGVSHLFANRRMRWRQNGRMKITTSKTVNCGWIFDVVQADGSFKVELYGLVNRHIMSVILGKATMYAKLLDHDDVQRAAENPDNFKPLRATW